MYIIYTLYYTYKAMSIMDGFVHIFCRRHFLCASASSEPFSVIGRRTVRSFNYEGFLFADLNPSVVRNLGWDIGGGTDANAAFLFFLVVPPMAMRDCQDK